MTEIEHVGTVAMGEKNLNPDPAPATHGMPMRAETSGLWDECMSMPGGLGMLHWNYALEVLKRFGNPARVHLSRVKEATIRKAGQIVIDDLIDRGGWCIASNDDLADYMTRIVDACVRAALSAPATESDHG